MSTHFELGLAFVLAQEGGFAKLKNDEITNLGVKKTVYEEWIGKKVDEATMKKLSFADVRPIYEKNYWLAAGCDKLPWPFALCVFDFAVNSGVRRATDFLAQLTKVNPKDNEKLQAALKTLSQKKWVEMYCDARVAFLRTIRNYDLYGRGWEARVKRLRKHCLDILANEKSPPTTT